MKVQVTEEMFDKICDVMRRDFGEPGWLKNHDWKFNYKLTPNRKFYITFRSNPAKMYAALKWGNDLTII